MSNCLFPFCLFYAAIYLFLFVEIAALADEYSDVLVPDEGCEYDQIIELNLDEVCVEF